MATTRRTFLAAAAAGLSARAAAGPEVGVAIVGLGGRGGDHLTEYLRVGGARIVALCDVNQAALERAQAKVKQATGVAPRGVADMRELLTDKTVDAVSLATPNHWHALQTLWSIQAGKDVYVEKPACHNLVEGRRMIEAARKYGRIVQVGLQSRSQTHKRRAMELLAEGAIGKVYQARAICFKRRRSIGHKEDSPTPPGVNWDLFLGPAPLRPFNELRFKYNWHWFWDTGNGDIGNNGVHQIDIARWGLGVGLPRRVVSTGGKYVYQDDQETPNTQISTFDYGDKEIVVEVRGLPTGGEAGMTGWPGNLSANEFYGADGYMTIDDSGYRIYRGEKLELAAEARSDRSETKEHMANFLDAVRRRDAGKLTAPVEAGVLSADLAHLANISYRVGRVLDLDASGERTVGDEQANALTGRKYRAPYLLPEL
jgi:predicted dehydrogenase